MTVLIRHRAAAAGICAAIAFAGCGGDSSSPSPTNGAGSISVTVTSPLKVGQTAQASGIAMFSGGRTEALTTGWRSDTIAVATATDSGLITGIANGNAVISVSSGSQTGRQTIRVAPDYDGVWTGSYRVTACSETGYVASQGFCAATLNTSAPVRFTVSQNGLSTSTGFSLGQLGFPTAAASIESAGELMIADTVFSDTVAITARWSLQQATAGALTGTVHQRWEVPNRTGEGVLDGEIVSVTRAAGPPVTLSRKPPATLTLRDAVVQSGFNR